MLRRTVLLVLAFSSARAKDRPGSPEDIVRSFIRDYYAWNNRAAATIGKPRDAGTHDRIQHGYMDILTKYCPPGFKGEPLAYGSNSTPDPEKSVIVAVDVLDTRARVRTQKPMGSGLNAMHTHEFDLQRREGRWFIVGVFYIDGKERLPSL